MNFSTLPSESISFCLPVKKGWHLEHISTLMLFFVERVWTTFPQTHMTVESSYLGCPVFFIFLPPNTIKISIVACCDKPAENSTIISQLLVKSE